MRWLAVSLIVLAACSPQDMADKVARRSAKSVVLPVVAQYMPSGQADAAANCIIDNASAGEISTLARDIGTRAGTTTVQTVVAVSTRPSTVQCLMTQGIPPLTGITY